MLERRDAVRDLPIDHPEVESMNNVFERALVTMHKMPRIWSDYLEFLMSQKLITRTRRAFDRALQSLPVTQHDRIWILYLRFINQPGIPVETAVRVYRRYLKLEPGHAEEYIAYLKIKSRWGEAARRLADVVNDETFVSLEGKTRHALWLELCELITRHPDEVVGQGLNVDAILRSGIRRFTNEVGRLWTSLADYYTRRGMFEHARDVYEEALTSVVTVRDFSLVFDALMQFEEALIAAGMESLEESEEDDDGEKEKKNDREDTGEDFLLVDDGHDLDLRLARLESLVNRRPELLSSVMLRQNPHNVAEWHKRARLFAKDPSRQILCYTEAVQTVQPDKAVGKLFTLWAAFAKLYERHKDLTNARVVFEKAAQVPFAYVDDLASIWTEWIEMELRHKNFKKALELARRATSLPSRLRSRDDEVGLPVQERLYRSARLWGLRVDLEESLGTMETVKAAYMAAMDAKVATVQMILNYAQYLIENRYFEESFRAYERGISLFKFPHVGDVWKAYLKTFVDRYGGKKIERTRDLFRQVCNEAPPEESRPFFLEYAAFEEKFGLARNAMGIYEAAVQKIPQNERLGVYEVFLARASDFFGIGKVREVYEMAIEAEPPHGMSDDDTRVMCLRYAALERRLGEIDRARAIFVHASAMSDPRSHPEFWSEWNDFEVKYGNEDTFREMLRIKRSVAAAFSQQHFNTSVINAAVIAASTGGAAAGGMASVGGTKRKADEMVGEGGIGIGTRLPGFVSAGIIQQQGPTGVGAGTSDGGVGKAPENPEDIDLEEDQGSTIVETAPVPAGVYGKLGDRFNSSKE